LGQKGYVVVVVVVVVVMEIYMLYRNNRK